MIMLIEIVDRAYIKSGAVFSSNHGGGLMKDFTTNDQLFRHLLLQQPAEEPIILVHRAAAVVDPIATAAIGRPVTRTFLHPDWEERAIVTDPETFALVATRDFKKRKYSDHRGYALLVLLNKPIFETEFGIAITELVGSPGGKVECPGQDNVKLPIRNKAVVEFVRRPEP